MDKAGIEYTKVDHPEGLKPLAFDTPNDVVQFCQERDVDETVIAFADKLGGGEELPDYIVYINIKESKLI